MNAGMSQYSDEIGMSYAVDFGRDREPMKKQRRRPEYRRAGSAPARVNGIHHRRNKRWTWGSGRGASMLNVRAFAGCLGIALASFASAAIGVTIDFKPIGNLGNSPNPSSNPANSLGAVATAYLMSTTETTNAQYVSFLNAVGASNTNGVYNALMNSGSNGGIIQSGSPGSFTYSVKPGLSPSGVSFANMPVNYVSWFSAARFVNWLAGGQQTGAAGIASMEVGSYTLASATSGNVVARNSNATFVLPNANEWYKAAFYNGSAYTNFATNSNSAPTATSTVGTSNAANFNSAFAGPMAVASYTNNSTSAYGMYDMMGNVTEWVEPTTIGANAILMGGNWQSVNITGWSATTALRTFAATSATDASGFRVAAVPEPGTIALAATGILGAAGAGWLKRRKRQAAALAAAASLAG